MSDAVESVFLAQRRDESMEMLNRSSLEKLFGDLLQHDVFCGNGNEDCT